MTSRNDRSRKRARKARRLGEHEAQERAAEELRLNPPPPEPINFSRLRQVFATMSFRSHEKGGTKPFADHVIGPHVEASTPEELVTNTSLLRDNYCVSYVEPGVKEPIH